MMIKFYRQNDRFGEFSNFYPSPIIIDGLSYPTAEHLFQSYKTVYLLESSAIRLADSPKEAKRLGNECRLRSDWEQIKDKIMFDVLLCKFTQNTTLKNILISTSTDTLIEDAPYDYYWGCGKDGTGKNMLGQLLEKVREILK